MGAAAYPTAFRPPPETMPLIAALTGDGAEVRFVGGCVRDFILGKVAQDIDLTTNARPERVMALLERAKIRAIPTGIDHGTVTAIISKKKFEVTTLRRDVDTNGRHAIVQFGTDWAEDAARRDFTFNAMSMTPDGTLYDPFNGKEDLLEGRVRFVGDAPQRVREDVLRILRWFRFHAHYGKAHVDEAALSACKGFAFRLPDLSGERIRRELLLLLKAPNPLPSLKLMIETNVLDAVLGRGYSANLLKGLCKIERLLRLQPDSVLRLAALIGNHSTVAPVVVRLFLSNLERNRLDRALAAEPALTPKASQEEQRTTIYKYGARQLKDRVLLAWSATPTEVTWKEWWHEIETFTPPKFPLKGKDLTALGIAESPLIGDLLRQVENWWISEAFAPDRNACLSQITKIRQNSSRLRRGD
jgi:poly(A) polymerase